jgi:hypothetical protein
VKYKTIDRTTNTTEEWSVVHYDHIAFIPQKDDLQRRKFEAKERVARELLDKLMDGGIEWMEEYDVERNGYLIAGRCKWLHKKD